MLMPSLTAIAREILTEHHWKHDDALAAMVNRLESDKSLSAEVIRTCAADVIRMVGSSQRVRLHQLASRVGADSSLGLEAIARESFLDTYLLLNDVRLGDAREQDLQNFIAHHHAQLTTTSQRIKFARAILKSPKFKKGKRVRDCFTDLEIARLAGES